MRGVTDLIRRLLGRLPRVFTRYTAASVAAGVASEAVLLTAYGTHLLTPGQASAAGWASGALVNYGLNRWWVFRHREQSRPVRETLGFWLTSLAALGLSTWATGLAGRLAAPLDHGLRVAVVGAVFLGVYASLFVAKFAFFNYFVFAGNSGSGSGLRRRRSRHQVPTTTRE
ncbi:Putative flippase GtrA (transmembrane translocase of bactoprenol-linked glucose) [Nonomuraea maritima]|uniref:Putative flippase GtrA (Transmembrane translocase of bactoprenol-linked glucose) n=1 Tax=Nonomuraea maritima TaxID=683260 RepID=A0A1G8UXJ5_9ACTN|nr:GtrA family protein [Nonomuraea maritima]SDJ58449.1 Putative flippase GtrA (transmembrane translocase of bactoprenol-linked glucose) [Nonomuraea maritima]